jgi:hypothetical protein
MMAEGLWQWFLGIFALLTLYGRPLLLKCIEQKSISSRPWYHEADALCASHHLWTSSELPAATKERLQISPGQNVSTDKG